MTTMNSQLHNNWMIGESYRYQRDATFLSSGLNW